MPAGTDICARHSSQARVAAAARAQRAAPARPEGGAAPSAAEREELARRAKVRPACAPECARPASECVQHVCECFRHRFPVPSLSAWPHAPVLPSTGIGASRAAGERAGRPRHPRTAGGESRPAAPPPRRPAAPPPRRPAAPPRASGSGGPALQLGSAPAGGARVRADDGCSRFAAAGSGHVASSRPYGM